MSISKGTDCIGIAICGILHDGQGNVFLNKRSRKCRDEWDRWDNWGGSLKFGEEFEDCLRRELKEEASVDPLEIKFGGVANTLRTHEGEKTHWVCIVYSVLVDPKQAKNGEPDKFSEVGWFKYGEWPSPLHSCFKIDTGKVIEILKTEYPGFSISMFP
ncbi:MAG: NUDIX domain-containing protein [Pseudomonadales bacterium]|jgi:ADP-ribose pyrophosphatase YjhB (NUDIX family)|nr:NUDIX domain-containing protein [Pseudomonadales bacterium]